MNNKMAVISDTQIIHIIHMLLIKTRIFKLNISPISSWENDKQKLLCKFPVNQSFY